jgi:SMC interacting uncharacterized protein involved in chromosome segregation
MGRKGRFAGGEGVAPLLSFPFIGAEGSLRPVARLTRNSGMDVEAEIRDLKRRAGELEGSFGFLTRQVQGVHKDLLSFEEKTEKKLQEHDSRFDRLESKVEALDLKIDTKIDGLAKSLPGIVAETMREVWNEQREKK